MNSLIYPEFFITTEQKWPFSISSVPFSFYTALFDKTLFKEDDYIQTGILLPSTLKTAVNKRKAEYLAGRLCAREAIQLLGYCGYPSSKQNRRPIWPNGLCGSISHSQQHVAAVVAKNEHLQNIGLDIEKKINPQRSQKLLNTILNHKEQQLITNDVDLSFFTTLAFSVKESLFKALYPLTLTYFYFKHAEITGWCLDKKEVYLELSMNLSTEWQIGSKITGYFCEQEEYIWTLISIAR